MELLVHHAVAAAVAVVVDATGLDPDQGLHGDVASPDHDLEVETTTGLVHDHLDNNIRDTNT